MAIDMSQFYQVFFEEAAGISKYKERRKETEGRLSDARDNLTRLEDIRNELGQQIGREDVGHLAAGSAGATVGGSTTGSARGAASFPSRAEAP